MPVSFDAFAPGIDRLVQDLSPGSPCAFNADDHVGWCVSLTQNGRPFPAGQLISVETKEVNSDTKIMTVVEEVGFKTQRRHGKDSLTSVVASRSYSYPVWWNGRQGKWCPGKGVKLQALKDAAPWTSPDGQPIEIWSHLVLMDSMKRFGFETSNYHYIGKRRKQGTRTEGRENRTVATPPVLSSALAERTAPALVNPPAEEVYRKVDLGESNPAPPTNSLDDVRHIVERFRRLDLD